jgi:hypothetical protein
MAIKPISLPSGAGIDYSSGDVRHFSQGDAMNVPGLTGPTRNLAERDNKLAEKLNEVVQVVNNHEQFVPLPVIRTIVPANEEIIVVNYRIPVGFEARVLNAVISTTPSTTNAQIDVLYSPGFGGSAGTSVVTVTPASEFTGDVNFYQTGEFVVSLKNTGAATLEIAASLMLTMRPLGAEGSLLVGSIIEGPEGPIGPIGPRGLPGPPGTGGAGSPGMNWRNNWINGASYLKNDVVQFAYSGTYGSWISTVAHIASLGVNDPQTNTTIWNPVAYGVVGPQGSTGTPGTPGTPGVNGGVPNYSSQVVFGTLTTGADWQNIPRDGYWTTNFSASTVYNQIGLREVRIESPVANLGFQRASAFLFGQFRVDMAGNGTFTLPKQLYGAAVDYTNTNVTATAVTNGTLAGMATLDGTNLFTLVPVSTDSFVIKCLNSSPLAVAINVVGFQTY